MSGRKDKCLRERVEEPMSVLETMISFYLYSFVGWFYESTICSFVNHRHFINRGFLMGPYCPIYGVGAAACYLCFRGIENPFLLFLASAILCGIIEYFTSYVMEKACHAKWWDYSHFPFQLHGRICLYGLTLFGAGNVVLCHFVQPRFLGVLRKVHPDVELFLVIGLTLIFCIDATITMFSWTSLNKNLKELHEKVFALTNEKMEDVSDYLVDKLPFEIREEKNGLQVRFDNVNVRLKKAELRFIHAFPKMEFSAYGKLSNKLRMREHTMNVFDRNIRRK